MLGIVSGRERASGEPTWVRFGPDRARARTCRAIVWQLAHESFMNRLRPARRSAASSASRAGRAMFASQARNAAGPLREHLHRHVGVLDAAELRALARGTRPAGRRRAGSGSRSPGIMSILRLSAGTQKLWITSAVVADDVDPRVDRDVDLVRGDRAGRPRIADLPPPLMADHVDRHRACCCGFGGAVWPTRYTSETPNRATSATSGHRDPEHQDHALRQILAFADRTAAPAGRAATTRPPAALPPRGTPRWPPPASTTTAARCRAPACCAC